MPTHPLIPYVESPDGLGHDILSHSSASMPGTGSSMTPHASLVEKTDTLAESSLPLDCMFCEETFLHQEDLGPHLLSQHPTTFHAPAVLRVEAEFLTPSDRARSKTCPAVEKNEELCCVVCSQAIADATELETHMRKHKDSFTYCCSLCGRRFKEPWFLKNHMRTHGKSGSKNKNQDLEIPTTVNDVIQDQPPSPVVTSYKMCMVCGFFFHNKKDLAEHSKVHNREPEVDENLSSYNQPAEEIPVSQKAFLQSLQLHPSVAREAEPNHPSGRWISQLDPFNTYQAWQLATRGKIAAGPNLAKELNADSNSENEDSGSEKEELGAIWASGGGDKPPRRGLRSELKPTETPSPSPEQKLLIRKDKPTNCDECGKIFRTYHQLVLHSRIHKKERGGEESPTTPVDGMARSVGSCSSSSLDRAEEYSEDGSEEGVPVDAFNPDKIGDGQGKMKLKILAPRKCNYCGKTFRSNYYLNIHLRTHTGEKPYKCEYCDYAAAQKTSLRYHLDRRHKDKPFTEIPNIPATPSARNIIKAIEPPKNVDDKQALKPPKQWLAPKPLPASVKHEPGLSRVIKSTSPSIQVKQEFVSSSVAAPYTPASEVNKKYPLPVNLKMEEKEASEAPLNLSFKVSLSVSATSVPRNLLLTNTCTSCSYETLYPEVLLMHKKLIHKESLDVKKNGYRGPQKLKRYTGCPPALEGKDVTPLPHINKKHPRRTKSPLHQPEKLVEKLQKPPQMSPQKPPQKVSPAKERWRDQHQEGRRVRESDGTSLLPRLPEQESSRKVNMPLIIDRELPKQRPGMDHEMNQRSSMGKTGMVWATDPARLCLSDRFRSLTQMEAGEPSNKRQKSFEPLHTASGRLGEDFNRLVSSGRNPKTLQTNSPLASVKVTPTSSPNSMQPDWNVMNMFRTYTPNNLASLYHPIAPGANHSVMASPVSGSRSLIFPQYSTSMTQRRIQTSPLSNERCGGPSDKNS